ncbi:MAG: hypothetical protein RMJ98_00950 [Myxococcales bacterium]|nr:hypothetical protein [Myxococcales bacterium]
MQRSTTITLGAFVVGAVGVLLIRGAPRPPVVERPTWSATLSVPVPVLIPPLSAPSLTLPESLTPTPAPERRSLPANAPKSVRFGVVLVQYRGAQFAPEDAPYKPDALQRARQLAELARKDFKAAVRQGDPGSVEDAGRMVRGILEPAPEVELFSLAPGAVGGPIDTPRGYWIVRRIE